MKTYLARLVARAQPPAPPRATLSAADAGLFTEAAPLTPAFASRIDEPPSAVSESQLQALRPLSPLPPASTFTGAPIFPAPAVTPPLEPPAPVAHPARAPLGSSLTPPPLALEGNGPVPHVLQPAIEPSLPDAASVVRENPAPIALPGASAEKSSRPPGPPVPLPSPSPSEGDTEARLLHAADVFMSRLLRPEEPPVSLRPSPSSAASPATASLAPSPPRLEPASAAPVAPPPPPAPSVVIGRLSVEIVPPPAPAHPGPAAPREVPRRVASHSLPAPRSSARFGLGPL